MTASRTDLDRIVQEGFLTSEQANRLKTAGIEDGPQLVKAWRGPAERLRLARVVGSPMPTLMRAVFVANLLSQTGPGPMGIDILLQHQEYTIPEFEDTASDHDFVNQDRQGIIGYAGKWIHRIWTLSNYRNPPWRKTFAGLVGFWLVMLGLIVYTYWPALSGKYGPNIASQFAQEVGRRGAWQLIVQQTLFLWSVGILAFSSMWAVNRVSAWFSGYIDRQLGRTPRDVLLHLEAQYRTPPAWAKVDQMLDRVQTFLWVIPSFIGVLLPGARAWIGPMTYGLLFSWTFLKIKTLSVGFFQIDAAWALQARPRQAGLMLAKMVTFVLVMGVAYGCMFGCAGVLCRGVDAWIFAQTQTDRSELLSWLTQQTRDIPDPGDLGAYVREETQPWLDHNWTELWDVWRPVMMQVASVGLFAIASGAAVGWFYFIRHKRWLKALLLLTGIYLVLEIIPGIEAWWLFQTTQADYAVQHLIDSFLLNVWQAIVESSPSLTIGLFFALGQEVLDSSQDRHLDHECPQCHLLHVAPGCKCEQIDGFEQVLALT